MKAGSNRTWVKVIIVMGFLLASIAVAGAAYLTFKYVEDLAADLQKNAVPDIHRQALQDVLHDLFKAESSVRAFTITQNVEDLEPYYQASITIETEIADLNDLSSQGELMDSVDFQVKRKFGLMDSLIRVLASGTDESAFDKLYEKITKAAAVASVERMKRARQRTRSDKSRVKLAELPIIDPPVPNPDTAEVVQTEEIEIKKKDRKKNKPGLFRKIFGNKKEVVAEDTTAVFEIPEDPTVLAKTATDSLAVPIVEVAPPTSPDPRKLLKEFKKSAEQYEKQESEQLASKAKEILVLTEKDQEIMSRIIELMDLLGAEHQSLVKQRVLHADEKASFVTNLTRYISLVVGALFILLLFVIFRDFSRNRKLQRRLSVEKNRAENLAKAKEEFLSNMSHEIRTPMNAVIGFSEQLDGTSLDNRQKNFLTTIRKSAKHLLSIINDVLDYSKIESGNFTLEKIGFRPLEIVDEVHETFYHLAKEKGLKLEADARGKIPEIVLGDPVRLKQMLFNLVNNALKFTDSGKISLRVEPDIISSKKTMLRFTIEDTGVGIPKDKLTTIFEDFQQADSSTTRKYGGTGLGLSITQRLTELHQGHISIESETGKGTAITLNIPYNNGDTQDLPKQETPISVNLQSLAGKHALVADDEPYNQALVEVILEKWKVKYDMVGNGMQALKLLEKKDYDFILLDLQMPIMGGMEAVGKIRNEMDISVPVIGLTATSTQAEIDRCLQAGMDGHLLKPFQEFDLYSMIMDTLGISLEKTSNGQSSPVIVPPVTAENGSGYRLEELFELGNNDKVFVKRMLDLFVNNTQQHLREMKTALSVKDWEKVGFTAHKIIPPVRHLGLHELVAQLKQIETNVKSGENEEDLLPIIEQVSVDLDSVIESVLADMEDL